MIPNDIISKYVKNKLELFAWLNDLDCQCVMNMGYHPSNAEIAIQNGRYLGIFKRTDASSNLDEIEFIIDRRD